MTRISPNVSIFIINTNSLILLLKDRLSDGTYVRLNCMLFTKDLKWHKIECLGINLVRIIKKKAKNAVLTLDKNKSQSQKQGNILYGLNLQSRR